MGQTEFSVIVPTYERERALANCLQALAEFDYPRANFEVIVADDGSWRRPRALLEGFRRRLDVGLLALPHVGAAAARNAAAAVARFNYLAFTDDDCLPSRDWLKSIAAVVRERPGDAIGGATVNSLVDNPCAVASAWIADSMLVACNPQAQRANFLPTCNLTVPAERFRALGGFDARTFPHAAGEDRDFCYRWIAGGFGMVYAPEAVVYHANGSQLGGYWRQHFTRGRAAFHYHRKRGWVTLFDGSVTSVAQAAMLWEAPLRIWPLLLLWRSAHLAGFAWQAARCALPRATRKVSEDGEQKLDESQVLGRGAW